MDNIRIIYRILSVLEDSMDTETFDERSLSPETLGITRNYPCQASILDENADPGRAGGRNIRGRGYRWTLSGQQRTSKDYSERPGSTVS